MCTICNFNQAKVDDFAAKLLDTYNHAALALMISIGHQLKLFDQLANMEPATSEEIAGATGLNERYVREWLNTLVVGRVIDLDDSAKLYHLPLEHANYLIRAKSGENMAVFAQYIPVLAQVEDKIIQCFKNGGGVPYSEYKRFHQVMAEDSEQTVISSLIHSILPLDLQIVESLEKGISVLDIGCGSGKAINLLAENYPNSQFTGYDLCLEPLEIASLHAQQRGLNNVIFEQVDLTCARARKSFDLITAFDAIHDQAWPNKVLKFIYDSLKVAGTFLMQDIDASENVLNNINHPMGSLLYTCSTMHCMTVSLAQGGMGLGTMWGREMALRMLDEVGFETVTTHRLDHDIQNCYFIAKK